MSAVEERSNDSARLEAFSDGVMAIAITLLVLDLVVPTREELAAAHQSLAQALGQTRGPPVIRTSRAGRTPPTCRGARRSSGAGVVAMECV